MQSLSASSRILSKKTGDKLDKGKGRYVLLSSSHFDPDLSSPSTIESLEALDF
jgi:hypothetical protein